LGPSGTGGEATSPISEYDLKIDTQVEKFLENKHKLVYFLVTASAAPIVIVVQFAYGKSLSPVVVGIAIAGILAGLAAAASALRALQFELASYRNHIQHRYARKAWDGLTPQEQSSWSRVNQRAAAYTKTAFLLVCIEFALFAAVGISLLVEKPANRSYRFSIEVSSDHRRKTCTISART
jgi:hypothetical protein